MIFEPSQKAVSDFLGAASITCWLFAQFPQVIENYRIGSCKGLALPFLVNWLLGDLTNLIGCIFTDQLPFQTYLATYFTVVDCILVIQFWYYGRKHKHRLRHAHHYAHPHSHPGSRQGSQYLYSSGTRTRTSSSRTRGVHNPSMTASFIGNNGVVHNAPPKGSRMSSRDSVPTLVHFEEQQARAEFPPIPSPSHRERNSSKNSSDSEEGIDGLPEMAESTLSHNSDASSSTIGALQRGRSVFRPSVSASAPDIRAIGVEGGAVEAVNWRQASGSRARGVTGLPRDRPSQSRTRSVVFLSVWTMISIGGLYRRSTAALPSSIPDSAWKINLTSRELLDHPVMATIQDGLPVPPPPIDYSLLVGRAAAWMCVCFYLTSRMPQIWKNFQRRSVEGLSILLFAAAFMGNLFYVLSILSSPLVQEDEGYLFESVPFLLGSGGTLVFDLTIMGQACLYAGLAPKSRERLEYANGEESSGLLAREGHNTSQDDLEQREG